MAECTPVLLHLPSRSRLMTLGTNADLVVFEFKTMPSFVSSFWNERFWLPRNVTWADLRNSDEAVYAQPSDLWISIPYALILFGIRILIERLIAKPIGRRLKISDVPNKPPSPNVVLERVYEKITKNPNKERLEGLCKQLNWKERQVLKWFHRKRDQYRPTTLTKFAETMWRFLFYAFVFAFGLVAVSQTDCPVRTRACWEDYPEKPHLTSYIYWYYQTEMAFYLSCVISQFFDIRRKDFWIMFWHHIATIVLIVFSYSVNFTNIGMLIMSLHDFSDIFLESSKLAKYSKQECLGTLGLVAFALTFLLARLVYFPFWVLRSVYLEVCDVVGPFPSWYLFSFWLCFLQVLHIYWFTFIIKGFVEFVKSKGKEKERSKVSFCEAVIKSYLEGKYKNASKFTRKDHHQAYDVRSESEDSGSEEEIQTTNAKVQSSVPSNSSVQRRGQRQRVQD